MTVRIGLMGAGNISETHARAARDIPDVELVAYWARDPAKTAALAQRYGGKAYGDLEEFLGTGGLEAVVVGTPSGLHAEHARAAVRHGLHVLVEKPLDTSSARIDALIADCERAGVKLAVIYQDRTAPDLVWLKQLIAAGGLGRPILVSARVPWYRPPEYYGGSRWRGTWALDGGGALMNQGTHTVDLLLWLLGDVERAYATTRTALHAIEVEDTVVACLEFTGGAVGTLEVTTAAFPGMARRVELTGTGGTIVVERDRIVSLQLCNPPAVPPPSSGTVEGTSNPSASSPVIKDVTGHRRVLEDFAAAIRTGGTPLCDGREGRRSVVLVEALYQSARTGAAVT